MLTNSEIIALMGSYTKDQLVSSQYPVGKLFLKSINEKDIVALHLEDIVSIINQKKLPDKMDVAKICFCMFHSDAVLERFFIFKGEIFRRLFVKLVYTDFLSKDEVEQLVGIRPFEETAPNKWSGGYENKVSQEFSFFSTEIVDKRYYGNREMTWDEYYHSINCMFFLKRDYRKLAARCLPKPPSYIFNPLNESFLNQDKIKHFNAELLIHQEFSIFKPYLLQGNVKYSEKGKPNFVSLKKYQKTLTIEEFYDISSNGYAMRTNQLLGIMFKLTDTESHLPLHELLRLLFVNRLTNIARLPLAVTNLNCVKGLTAISADNFSNEITNNFFLYLKEIPQNAWISWDNLLGYVNCRFMDFDLFSSYSDHYYNKIYVEGENYSYAYDRMKYMNGADKNKYVNIPFLKSIIFTFASLGLMEIAYSEIDETAISEYDGLIAFKLTNLGAYVLSHTNAYVVPEINHDNKIILDEENLIIRAEGNLSLLSSFLDNYFVKVSENRFAFKPELFLKDCKTAKQIENKIALFTQSLHIHLPDYWKQEFKALLSKAKSIRSVDVYKVFSINTNDKELLQIIAHDSVIKEIVTKAEGYKVMVLVSEVNAFKKRMLDFGYLIE